jgi:preprotein translocase subunit YajC
LVVGKSVSKINEAFEAVALEDGSYKLKENFEIEVLNGEITAVKEIFVEAKLKDGTVVKVEGDSLVEGAAVKVVTEEMPDGIAAPDGVHMLEDGTEVETKSGLIVSVKEAIKEGDSEVKSPESMGDGYEMPEDSIDAGDPIQIELMEMLRDFVKKISEKMSSMEQKMEAMNSEFSAFKKEPAGKKISDGKTEFNKISGESADEKFNAIMAFRQINKK